MIDILTKTFINDYENIKSQKVRTSYGVMAGIIGIFANFTLFSGKMIIGLLINSISIMADGINNLSDAASSVISLVGVKMAEKPADKEHPFGHGRIEYISALIVSFMVLLVGITLLKDSFIKILNPEHIDFKWIPLFILIFSVIIKMWLSYINNKLGKKINSKILLATAADARNDVIITSGLILSLVAEKFTGLMIDGWSGFAISFIVILSGYGIAKDTLLPLLGEAVDKDTYENITKLVESYDGIIGSHDLITHNYGPSHIMATIHVEVSNSRDLRDVHDIIDSIERDVLEQYNIHLLIHVDPLETQNKDFLLIKKNIEDLVYQLEKESSIHDFHISRKSQTNKISFDVVVPYTYNSQLKDSLLSDITDKLSILYPNYKYVIIIENSFIDHDKFF